jgi:hypothetical protein
MKRFTTITQDGTCGHKHRHIGRAIDCLDKFEDEGISARICRIPGDVDLLWIDNCLLKHTTVDQMVDLFNKN